MDNVEITDVIEESNVLTRFFTHERMVQIIASVIVTAIAVIAWMVITRMIRKILNSRNNVLPKDGRMGTITSVTYNIVKGIAILIVFMIVLEIFGINITSLLAGLGIASAVVGLALQDYIKDLISGARIVTDDFFQVGDVVRYGTTEGTITDFNLRATKLKNLADGSVQVISNRNISEIVKLSDVQFLDLPLPYEEDPGRIEPLLDRLCSEAQETFDDVRECVSLGLCSLEDSAVIYKVKIAGPPEMQIGTRRMVLQYLYRGIIDAGIQIPYNQLDVHLKDGTASE